MSFVDLAHWFLVLFVALIALQPPGMFDETGCPRSFGTESGQTLLPAWLAALGLSLQLSRYVQ